MNDEEPRYNRLWMRDEKYYARKTKYKKTFSYTFSDAITDCRKQGECTDLQILQHFVRKCEQFPECSIGTDDGFYGLIAELYEEIPMTPKELVELAIEYERWKEYKKTAPQTIRWMPPPSIIHRK